MSCNATAHRRAALAALAALSVMLAPAAWARHWAVAAPAACAEVPTRNPCKGGGCTDSAAPVRGRFDPVDVASGVATAQNPLPEAPKFPGPGACVEVGNGCGKTVPSPSSGLSSPPVVEQPPVPVKPPGVP